VKLNSFDLNKIHVFLSVVRHSGFRGASEELQLSRSALSQSIGTLEDRLGVRLFHRVGRRLVPTAAALRFYQEANGYQDQLQDAVSTLIGNQGRVEGVLRIGAYLEFAKGKMMPVIGEFLTRNPQTQIKFVFDSPSRLDALLEEQRIDLSISVFPHRNSKKITSSKLFQEELVLVGAPNLVQAKPRSGHFHSVPVIDYFSSHQVFKRWWTLHYHSKVFRGTVRSYAATADMVLEMAKRGLGVGVVPRYVYEGSDAVKMAHVIQPTEKRLYDFLWLNQIRRSKKSLAHQSFCALLDSRFRPPASAK
jgi:LysR family glycine cleavage system transcriptional activator